MQRARDGAEGESREQRRPYGQPHIVDYGAIASLTLGSQPGSGDGVAAMQMTTSAAFYPTVVISSDELPASPPTDT